MNIFITGGTGFLGYEVLKGLHARGHRLTALIRSPQRASHFPADVRQVQGGVEEPASYRQVLRGQEALVHIAALVKMWAPDRGEFDRVNVAGLEALLRAAADAGVRKFLYTSSFIALGPSNGQPLREGDPRRTDHFHNDYERTKVLGDQVARRHLEQGYPLTIVYPGVIYGPGTLTDGNIIARNVIPFLNGRMPFGLAIQVWSYAFVQDVVRAFVTLVEGDPPSRRYILGGDNQSGPDFYRALQKVTGKKPPAVNIPMGVALVAGYGEYWLARWFGRQPTMLTHEVVRIYEHSWAYDSGLAQRELGYRITPLKEGLAQMVSWLRSAGHVR
jgi:farnesol dehydrogenase